LSHAQVILLLGNRGRSRTIPYQHTIAARHQVLHLVAGKLGAVGTPLDALLFCAWPGFARLIQNFAVAEAPITLDVVNGIILVPKDFSPAIDQSLLNGLRQPPSGYVKVAFDHQLTTKQVWPSIFMRGARSAARFVSRRPCAVILESGFVILSDFLHQSQIFSTLFSNPRVLGPYCSPFNGLTVLRTLYIKFIARTRSTGSGTIITSSITRCNTRPAKRCQWLLS